MKNKKETDLAIDPTLLWPSILAVLCVIIPLCLFPEAGRTSVAIVLKWFTGTFGWLYLLTGISCFFFMSWLAFGPLGKIKLGDPDDKPEFKTFPWVAMLFCAGMGISLCNWSFVEPIYFLSSPPMHIASGTRKAAEWAAMYPMFHWGIVPWAIYLMPALPVGYAIYVKKVNILRLSEACRGVFGDRIDGLLGKSIDVIVIFSMVGAVGTSLGLSVPLVSKLFQEMFSLDESFFLQMTILALWISMIGWSVYNGLSKGIQTLSNINVVLGILMLLLILFIGPTLFLLNLWSNSFGLFLDNFFRINFWTDPVTKGGFPEGWTIFYWAWWVAYSPMMGLFVARISRGRTIKQIVIHGILWGSVGCWVFFAIWGGYALHIDITGVIDLQGILTEHGIPTAVVAALKTLPYSSSLIPLFTLLCFVFLATTVDSTAYMLASISTVHLSGYQEPAVWSRILWTSVLGAVGVGLLSVGGLLAVQSSTVLVALPMIAVLAIMGCSLVRWAYQDFGTELSSLNLARCSKENKNFYVREHVIIENKPQTSPLKGNEDCLPEMD